MSRPAYHLELRAVGERLVCPRNKAGPVTISQSSPARTEPKLCARVLPAHASRQLTREGVALFEHFDVEDVDETVAVEVRGTRQ